MPIDEPIEPMTTTSDATAAATTADPNVFDLDRDRDEPFEDITTIDVVMPTDAEAARDGSAPLPVVSAADADIVADAIDQPRAHHRQTLTPRPSADVDVSTIEPREPTLDELRAIQPAASDDDSPATGQVRIEPRAGLDITSGFSDGAGLQYFALDGSELFAVVETLMDQLHARAKDDLRFNPGLCYPRVQVKVAIEVTGFLAESGSSFTIEKRTLPDDPIARTNPLEFCRKIADEIAFVVIEQAQETDDQGESITPPDGFRDALGIEKPRKHAIGEGRGRVFVDVG